MEVALDCKNEINKFWLQHEQYIIWIPEHYAVDINDLTLLTGVNGINLKNCLNDMVILEYGIIFIERARNTISAQLVIP